MTEQFTELLTDGTLVSAGEIANYAQIQGKGTITGSASPVNMGQLVQQGGAFTLGMTGGVSNSVTTDLANGYQLRLTGGDLVNIGTLELNGAVVTGSANIENALGGLIEGPGTVSCGLANSGGTLSVPDGTTVVAQPFASGGIIRLSSASALLRAQTDRLGTECGLAQQKCGGSGR